MHFAPKTKNKNHFSMGSSRTAFQNSVQKPPFAVQEPSQNGSLGTRNQNPYQKPSKKISRFLTTQKQEFLRSRKVCCEFWGGILKIRLGTKTREALVLFFAMVDPRSPSQNYALRRFYTSELCTLHQKPKTNTILVCEVLVTGFQNSVQKSDSSE